MYLCAWKVNKWKKILGSNFVDNVEQMGCSNTCTVKRLDIPVFKKKNKIYVIKNYCPLFWMKLESLKIITWLKKKGKCYVFSTHAIKFYLQNVQNLKICLLEINDLVGILEFQWKPQILNLDLANIVTTLLGDKLNITAKFLKNNFAR